jgi:outer membrane lipoprotein-sorting protein
MEINTEGSQIGSQTVTLDKIEMNVDIDDNIFKMPAE